MDASQCCIALGIVMKSGVACCDVLCCAVLCCAVKVGVLALQGGCHAAVLCCAVPCCAVLCCDGGVLALQGGCHAAQAGIALGPA